MRVRPTKFLGRGWILGAFSAACVLSAGEARVAAQVRFDGSLGGRAGTLSAVDRKFQITADYGRQVGRNLFHSFSDFNLVNGETAVFSGPTQVQNILARVTGGNVSSIDGTIRSEIPGANFFLMNPAGIVFGPNASIDVSGAFTATTADYIRLADGRRFSADPAERLILTSADPRAFGFLPSRIDPPTAPQPIVVNGATLSSPDYPRSLIAGAVMETGVPQVPDGFQPVQNTAIGAAAVDHADGSLPREVNALTGEIAAPPVITPGSVVLDGTLGPAGPVAGPVYQIGAELGQQRGGNLFQSFSDFHLNEGEVAIFGGPTSVQNLLVRVTGQNPVSIGGALMSDISGANLFLMSPRGIIFRDNSTLSLSGSFFATTANYLKFQDNIVLSANAEDRVHLSGGGVERLGFDGSQIAGIHFAAGPVGAQIGASTLQGRSFSLVAPKFFIDGATVDAPEVIMNLVAPRPGSEIPFVGGIGNPMFQPRQEDFTGSILFRADHGQRPRFNLPGGRLNTFAGMLTLEGSATLFDGRLVNDGYPRLILADMTANITGDVVLENGSQISALTEGQGRGHEVHLIIGGKLTLGNSAGIFTEVIAGAGGDGATLNIQANSIHLFNSSAISGSTSGTQDLANGQTARGGDIMIQANNRVTLDSKSSINSDTYGTGPAGNVTILAPFIELKAGAEISATTYGEVGVSDVFSPPNGQTARGGNITIWGNNRMTLDSRAIIKSETYRNAGSAGSINLIAPIIELTAEAEISATTYGSGDAGDISLTAGILRVIGIDFSKPSLIAAGVDDSSGVATGHAGIIQVEASASILLARGARISVTTDSAKPRPSGVVPSIQLFAAEAMTMENSTISASATAGDGGDIALGAGSGISIRGTVLTATAAQNGGTIALLASAELVAGQLRKTSRLANVTVDEHSTISANSTSGNGGNVSIDPEFIVLRDSRIEAKAEAGNGGRIDLAGHYLFRSNALLDASSEQGLPGLVNVSAPDVDLSGSLAALVAPTFFTRASPLYDCRRLASSGGNSFYLRGKGGVSP